MKHWIRTVPLLVLLGLTTKVTAQDELKGYDYIYNAAIHSVKFTPVGLVTSLPIVALQGGRLELSFDDLDGGTKRYRYVVEYCNRDWTTSTLATAEYLSGFDEDEIRNVTFSSGTRHDYSHYSMTLPNNQMTLIKSGNYLLHVFDSDNGYAPVLTRRFMLVDKQLVPRAQLVNPLSVTLSRTHQQMQLSVNIKDVILADPMQDIRAVILQNGRWDVAIKDIPPAYQRGDDLVFDQSDNLVFPGGKEFRQIDIRSWRVRTERVQAIEEYNDGFVVFAEPDPIRVYRNYLSERDINGQFIIENKVRSLADVQSEYMYTNFILETEPLDGNPAVYLIGALTDWRCYPQYQLTYNNDEGGYTGEFLLKQGYYNYFYALSNDEGKTFSTDRTEGNWYETDNEYTILLYYRPFGERFDALIGAETIRPYR